MEIRKVQIEKYWPLIVKNIEEFGQIAVAENEEFNRITKCIYDALSDCFILEATEYGVSRWEKMLGIVPAKDSTLDDRKATILSYLSVKIPYTLPVLRQMLTAILGDGNFEMSLDNDTQTLIIGFGLSTIHSKIDSVNSLIERVLPQNLAVELEWVDGLPIDAIPAGYRRLSYLESTGTQYIDTGVKIDGTSGVLGIFEPVGKTPNGWAISAGVYYSGAGFAPIIRYRENVGFMYRDISRYPLIDGSFATSGSQVGNLGYKLTEKCRVALNWLNDSQWSLEFDTGSAVYSGLPNMSGPHTALCLFARTLNGNVSDRDAVRIYKIQISQGEQQTNTFVPVLDTNTGQAGMFDIINKVFKTNMGTGDFLYPDKQTEATTFSLRNRMYGKITENGIRRLYRIPEGYNSNEEYAREHGFKILVETPIPEEGYWQPVWHDRKDCIEVEWVETEPPVEEEVIENE